jgi:malonyl-CoA O-methyltransferase
MSRFKFVDRGFEKSMLLIPGWATDWRIFKRLDIPFNYLLPERVSPNEAKKIINHLPAELRKAGISILGWSMGGFIAADLILKNPNVFERVVLISIRQRYDTNRIEQIRDCLRRDAKAYLYSFYKGLFSEDEKENKIWFKEVLLSKYINDIDSLYLFEGLDYLSATELKANLLNKPNVTFIQGENDSIAPIHEARLAISQAPMARAVFIKDACHLPFLRKEFTEIFKVKTHSDKAIIEKNFSKSASQYDEYAAIQRLVAERLVEEIPNRRFERILEIGCGTGIYTSLLNTRFRYSNIRAVDISERMVAIAREKIQTKNVVFEVGDAERMSLLKEYDLITSNSVFHWFESIEKVVLKYSGILNKGGWLVFSAFGPLTFAELGACLRKIRKEEDLFVASSYFWEKEKLERLLREFLTQVSVKEILVEREYPSLTVLLKEIKYTGTQGCATRGGFIWTQGLLDDLEDLYLDDNKGRIIATYQIFLCKAER